MKRYSDNYEFCVGIEKIQPIGFQKITRIIIRETDILIELLR